MTLTIQQILDLIEQRLDSPLSAAELAEQAGYSIFYFYRLFQTETGMSLMQYITRRKLLAAIVEISKGMRITEAGLKYGFSTHSGFFRAFVKEYGMSPSNYLALQPFPMQHRVQLEKEQYKFMHINQIKKLLPQWNIAQANIKPAFQPNNNYLSDHVWVIGEDYYLKLFDSFDTLQKELTFAKQMNSQQKILPSYSGNDYIESKGNYFMMFYKSKGTPLLSTDLLKHPNTGRSIGEMIGQITLQLQNISGDFKENDLLKTITEWALPQASQLLNLSTDWNKRFKNQITSLFSELPRQVIHRDLNGGNLLIHKNGFTPIDFELTEINFRIYDPCYFVTSILSEQFGTDNDNWLKLVKEVFIGYDQIVTLTKQEKEAIPYIVLANQLICVAYFAEYEKYSQFLKDNKDMTFWLIAEFNTLQSVTRLL
jgi:AraC-like DNA-binding protein/Ser/Thr protein kinase RdoA (MazF antagonist)